MLIRSAFDGRMDPGPYPEGLKRANRKEIRPIMSIKSIKNNVIRIKMTLLTLKINIYLF
jgi:hypothetical protein